MMPLACANCSIVVVCFENMREGFYIVDIVSMLGTLPAINDGSVTLVLTAVNTVIKTLNIIISIQSYSLFTLNILVNSKRIFYPHCI